MRYPTVLILIWLLFAPALADGQTATATLVIEARDQTGLSLPNVAITITNQDTGIARQVTTNADGHATALRLPPGTYNLTAALAGFKTEIIHGVRAQAAVRGTIAVILTPGDLGEQVIVAADATTVRIGNSTVGAVFESETLEVLPVTEREVVAFAVQAPGVAPPAPGSRLSTQGNTGMNSGGAREAANNYLLDGTDNNDLFLNRLVINPSLDAVQEVALLQNTYDAEYGRNAGAQLSMVLKSGTRTLRGTAFEFFRHSGLDARNPFQPPSEPKPLLQRHDFGGTAGGPLPLPRSFFFGNIEAIHGREADTRLAHVPTAAERSGVFSTAVRDPLTGAPFPGNTIPASRLDPAGVAAANLYPLPNRADADANLVSSPVASRNAVQFTVKTDHTLGAGSPANLRYSFTTDDRDQPFPVRARNLPGFGISVLDEGHNLAFGYARALSRRTFTELRVGLNALHRENVPQRSGNGLTLVVPGSETLGDDPNLPVVRRTRTIHVADALMFDRRTHHFKAGGEFRSYRSDGFNHLFERGQATFQGVFTGHPVADLLLGMPTITLIGLNDNRQALRTWSLNGFAQDDWRVNWKLTVNAGVRYEYNAPPYDADNRMRIFDLDTLQLQQVGSNGVSRSGLDGDFNNIAPRVGFSFDPTGYGRWLIRGGYGIFYDSGTLIENSALYFNPPYFSLQLFFPGAQPLRLANPFPAGRGFSPRPAINTLDPHIRTGYAQHGSLGVERAFGATTAAVRYVTSYGTDLVRKRNVNQAFPGPGPIDSRRPLPGLGDVLLVESAASSRYHALQLSAVRRPKHNLSFRAAYTLSNSRDDTSAFLATDGDDNTPQNSHDPGAEWGPSDYDVRHRLVMSGTYERPSSAGPRLLRHWLFSGVFTAQSGRPFTPRVSFDNSNTGNVGGGTFAYDRPNVITGAPPPGVRTVTYDGRTFAIAPQYTFGNAGRDSLTGPGYVALDAMVSRKIALGSDRLVTLRLEIFNALNRRNDQLPDSFVDRVTFGQSLATYAPRQIQLAARFAF